MCFIHAYAYHEIIFKLCAFVAAGDGSACDHGGFLVKNQNCIEIGLNQKRFRIFLSDGQIKHLHKKVLIR